MAQINLLDSYRKRIDRALAAHIEQMGSPGRLRDACANALLSGGKRLRPLLVLLVADALGKGRDVMPAALGVEYFHTASIIADDLPCMDNDPVRRCQPALHTVFPESVAVLASYTLIAAGYGAIYEESERLKEQEPHQADAIDSLATVCLKEISLLAGLSGATQGQFLDLFPPDQSYETIREIIQRKTATLFEISFVLGWLFGGGEPQRLEEVKACARHLGIAFQIADDRQDVEQDRKVSETNIVRAIGLSQARRIFQQELDGFTTELSKLGLATPSFQWICRQLVF